LSIDAQEKSQEIFGRGLRTIREAQKITLRDLAGKSGVGTSTIGHLETGKFTARPKILEKLAAAIGMSIDEITQAGQNRVREDQASAEIAEILKEGPVGAAKKMTDEELVRAIEKHSALLNEPDLRYLRAGYAQIIKALSEELSKRPMHNSAGGEMKYGLSNEC
jgi:transcriptional regulator with XRE-family HTH domain